MTQREHAGLGDTQCSRILARLKRARGGWVPMPKLVAASGGYAVHSRVAELRNRGHVIDNRTEVRGRFKRSFYRMGVGA